MSVKCASSDIPPFIRSPRRRWRSGFAARRARSVFAVLRLTTSSYLVGACTGRSAGFSPLRTRRRNSPPGGTGQGNQGHRRSSHRRRRSSVRSRSPATCAVLQSRRLDRVLITARALPVTIRPSFENCAKASIARSVSPASPTLIGVNSTPKDGATDWIATLFGADGVAHFARGDRITRCPRWGSRGYKRMKR